jgi:hypothetical protein
MKQNTTDVQIIFLHDDIHLFKSNLKSVLRLKSLSNETCFPEVTTNLYIRKRNKNQVFS